jgi:basic amino acid/polyamine antiporter, APA family
VTTAPDPTLVRALGRRDLTAFAINRVIGGGIFGIPAVLYAGVGPLSVLAILLAGLVVLCITLCFAEVGSRFRDTGGPYLYAHDTFGPVVGFEVGWLMWVTQLGGFAAVTNLFVN